MSTDSFWTENDLGRIVNDILSDAASGESAHHFGPSFMTAYQLAIRVKRLCPRVFQRFGRPLGGQGAGDRVGFAQYIARQLSRRIGSGEIVNLEGRFLSYNSVKRLEFEDAGDTIVVASNNPRVSMFRYRHPC